MYGGHPQQQGGYPPQQGRGYPAPQQSPYAPQPGYGQPSSGFQPQYGQHATYAAPSPYAAPPPLPQRGPQGWAAQYLNNVSPQQMQTLQHWFQSVDRDRSGSISAIELGQIQFNQRPIGVAVAKKLIRVFDRDNNGEIDFQEYAALHMFLMAMQNAFFAADRDRSGFIDANEMFQAVSGAGFQLSFGTIQALVNKFSIPGRGVDFPNYLFMCAHLAHARSIFEWNDTDRDGRITLTYDALAHIGTDILPS